jgi:WD40 repeat protein
MAIPTLFSTFYSFKGGVGRTLTLVNTAVELTRRGYQVIIWDMDIEAPGIQNIPYFQKLTGKIKTGFIDIAAEFIKNNGEEINRKIFNNSIITHPDNPNLHLLSAGNLENQKEYSQKFSSLRWDKLFGKEDAPGFQLFETIREALLNYHPDFVLIDSRTGFTDIGGICCFRLPDVVFLVFSYGSQQMKGIRSIYNSLTNDVWLRRIRLDRPLKTYLLASMIPMDRPDLRKIRREKWLENHSPDFNIHVEIPFNVEMAFNDTLWPVEYPDHQFCQYYSKIAGILEEERLNILPVQEKVQDRSENIYKEGWELQTRQLVPAAQFEQDTAQLFRLMGYEAVLNKSIAGSQIDIFLTAKTPIEVSYYIVECKHWEKNLGKSVVDEVENNLKAVKKEYPGCRAIIAAKAGFTREAKEYAAKLNITTKTYDELLRGIINFDRYVSYVKTLYAGTELEKNYIPQDVIIENSPAAQPLLGYADQWLAEPQGGFFTLLGDFGTGKTSFTKRLAHDLAIKYEKDKTASFIPVLINLKDVSKALGLENIIFDHFSRTANMNVSPDAFLHLLKEGKIILMFDGFDEMATQSNAALTMRNFQELNRAFAGKAKILLTCRTHYFKDRTETEETLKAKKKGMTESATQLYRAIQDKQGYSIGYLQEFGKQQIEEYLKKTMPDSWQETKGFIDNVYNLKDLASRPVLLDMIVKSLPAIKEKEDIQVTDLYSAYVQSWIDRNDWRHELTREGREFLAEEIAWRIWDQDADRVHYSHINELLKDYFKEKKTVVDIRELEYASSEVRTASFLTRDDQGNYGFAHRSFLEYFLARRIAGKLNDNDIKVLDIKQLSKEVILFLSHILGIKNLVKICSIKLSNPYQKRISENSLICLYWGLRYSHSPDGTIKDARQLRRLFSQNRPAKIYLQGADLEGVELSYMDFSRAILKKANMKAVLLTGATLREAVLNEADLSFALLDEADLSKARVNQAISHHASFKKAILAHADFSESDLHACNFLYASMGGARFTHSDLSYAGLLRATVDIEMQLSTANMYATGMPGTALSELHQVFQLGHSAPVVSAVFSPDETTIVSASSDNTIKLWDAANGREIQTLKGHSANVNSTTFSPDGTAIVSASLDNTVKLWDVANGREIRTLKGHSAGVHSAVFSPDGTKILSASFDCTIKLWDVANGREIRTLKGHSAGVSSSAFSPDGTAIVSASLDNTVKLWDVASGREIRDIKGHFAGVRSAAFSPDGTKILSASYDCTIKLWDVASGREIRTLKGHSAGVSSSAFSPDGTTIVSASYDSTIKLWDAGNGREIRTLTGHRSSLLFNSASFSPSGTIIVSADHDQTIKLWDTTNGNEIRTLKGYSDFYFSYGCSPAFSPNGTNFVSASFDHTLKLWDTKTWRALKTLKGHSGPVRSAAFSPDGRTLVSASSDGTLRIWDVFTGKEMQTLYGHSPSSVISAAFSPDGCIIASTSSDNTLKIWDASSGREIRTLKGHGDSVHSAVFSSDGKTLISASSDCTLNIWDVETGRLMRILKGHTGIVTSVAHSPVDRIIASASHDHSLKIWDEETGRLLHTLEGHSSHVISPTFSPDGRTIVSASHDHTIKFWNTRTKKEIATLKNIALPNSVVFSTNGKWLFVGTIEGMLLVKIEYKGKKIQGLEIAATFYHLPGNEWLVVGADNRFACSEGGRSYLYFRDQLALYPASDFPELESENVLGQ